jgi:4-hydroxythreonine-4-phosphate dehydrogenase
MALPIALTCGEPAGIGPELAIKARGLLGATTRYFWIGDPCHLPTGAAWAPITDPTEALGLDPHILPVLVHDFPGNTTPGHPDPADAAAVIAVIARAVGLVQAGLASAICTAPINKKALKDGAGFAFPGHTEYLADIAGSVHVAMMLVCPELRVVPATIHIPLDAVPATLTQELLEQTIRVTHAGLVRDFGVPDPRVAVTGLNPHAGEGGAMGQQELEIITPVIQRLAAKGMRISGPYPADTMFHRAARAGYDVAVTMYHDQALIPIKTIDFAGGVNVTLGLPFVRTSPDHGTAFDIAGQGIADPTSMAAALRLAQAMTQMRAR